MNNTSEKVAKIMQCMRRLWPQYDEDLDQQVNEMYFVLKFAEHSFNDAGYAEDYKRGRTKQAADEVYDTIMDLVYQEYNVQPTSIKSPEQER